MHSTKVPFYNDSIPVLVGASLCPYPRKPTLVRDEFNHTFRVHLQECLLETERGSLNIEPGDITCFAAGAAVTRSGTIPGREWVFSFRYPGAHGSADDNVASALPHHLKTPGIDPELIEECTGITAGFNAPAAGPAEEHMNRTIASARFYRLLLELIRYPEGRMERGETVLRRLLLILEQNLSGRIVVPEIARETGVSQTYLSSLFKQRYGLTINQYLQRRRIDRARTLLTDTELPVNVIGEEVGMADPHYFNKQFKKSTGTSPTRYRRENRAG